MQSVTVPLEISILRQGPLRTAARRAARALEDITEIATEGPDTLSGIGPAPVPLRLAIPRIPPLPAPLPPVDIAHVYVAPRATPARGLVDRLA